jgi:hypothetical protein
MTAGELRDAPVDLKLSRPALMDSPFVLVTPDADDPRPIYGLEVRPAERDLPERIFVTAFVSLPDADNAECPAGRVYADTDDDGFLRVVLAAA